MSENHSSEKPPEPEPSEEASAASEAEAGTDGTVEPSEPVPSTSSGQDSERVEPVGAGELDRLLNIEIPIIAVMGEKILTLNDILNLTVGSIIQLDKPAEEHLDLMVNNQRIGKGQTVRTGDNFGLQITELVPVRETIRKLGMRDDIPACPAGTSETPSEETTTEPSTAAAKGSSGAGDDS